MLKKLVKEPLLHFFVIAALLLWMHATIWPRDASSKGLRVEVNQQNLQKYLQSQTGVVDSERLNTALSSMPVDKRAELVQGYFTEEALYREALAMGLGKDDPAIRKHLVQRISLMTEQIDPAPAPSKEQLEAYFAKNAEKYAIEASITLAHVYIQSDQAEEAQQTLEDLKNNNVGIEDSRQYGDRFLYHANYTQRTPEFIAVHFDDAFSQAVFSSDAPTNQWFGPIKSQHGLHLVYISARSPARKAEFAEVGGPVLNDYLREQEARTRQQNLSELIQDYQLVIDDDLDAQLRQASL